MREHLPTLRRLLSERRRRADALPPHLCSGPGFAMLVDLAAQTAEARAVSVTSLCLASGAPATTALRYIDQLREAGLVERRPDPRDRRRVFLEFTQRGEAAMSAYLAALAPGTVQ